MQLTSCVWGSGVRVRGQVLSKCSINAYFFLVIIIIRFRVTGYPGKYPPGDKEDEKLVLASGALELQGRMVG